MLLSSLLDERAVEVYGQGTKSAEVASFIRALGEAAAQRVTGIGDEQYSSRDGQQYEYEPLSVYLDELLDEVTDVMAYLAIITIKIMAYAKRVDGAA